MAMRSLPGVYVNINDLSQLPEGQTGLTVGFALQADRGPVDELALVTSPSDFLTKFTLSGKPGLKDDKTFYSILKVLEQTNMVYVSRVANNPLYGGAVVKKQEVFGDLVMALPQGTEGTASVGAKIVIAGSGSGVTVGDYVMITGTTERENLAVTKSASSAEVVDGYFKVASTSTVNKTTALTDPGSTVSGTIGQYLENTVNHKVWLCTGITTVDSTTTYEWKDTGIVTSSTITVPENNMVITINGDIEREYIASSALTAKVKANPIVGIEQYQVVSTAVTIGANNTVTFTSNTDLTLRFPVGCNVRLGDSATDANNGIFAVESRSYDVDTNTMTLVLSGSTLTSGTTDSHIYYSGLVSVDEVDPSGSTEVASEFQFTADDLFLITGVNPGAYNGEFFFSLNSSADQEMIYDKTMTLGVYNSETGSMLESFTFSMDPTATSITGESLYIEDVINDVSAYIQVKVNESVTVTAATDLASSTVSGAPIASSGGSKGGTITANDIVYALDLFSNKATSISILGNGCSELAETALVQQKLISIADTRKDCIAFLSSPKSMEKANLASDRAQTIVDYKKSVLGSTSYYGCMYTPHVNVADVYNSKTVEIGTDAVAINGWLGVLNGLSYPYAYAGPMNGGVSGVTCNWKIGDTSGEATLLNDASINYIAFDPKAYGYYVQTQNTLQIANSTMRNLGAVFSILDIKEHLETLLKQYLNLPITDDLRMTIKDTMTDYLTPMVGTRLRGCDLQETSTEQEIMNGELHYLISLLVTPYLQRVYLTLNIVNSMVTMSILQSA